MNQDWLMVAQVYATLSASYRVAVVTTDIFSGDGPESVKSLRTKADQYEAMAQTALAAAGVQG